jgi:electron transfer flavoprotein alpha subunit
VLVEAELNGSPLLLRVAPHAVAAEPIGDIEVVGETAAVSELDQLVRVSEHATAAGSGVSLTDADVVVSGGRGVGSADGFAVIEELAELLHGAVGCSRAVTSAGWRPHTDQVGQTGTKISPEIYIACGISGATQHMAGCKGAKKLLAINPDGEASIFASADYGVIGDLHEVLPAISAEIRKARGT